MTDDQVFAITAAILSLSKDTEMVTRERFLRVRETLCEEARKAQKDSFGQDGE